MDKIAIVGMSCLFPGAHSTEEFWEALKAGTDCRVDAVDQDFGLKVDEVYSAEPAANKIYCLKGGFIRDFHFDSEGFDLAPDILDALDDVFQWSLYAARESLRDAGLWRAEKGLSKAGVIMGNYAFPTKQSNRLALPIWYREIRRHLAEHLQRELPPLGDNTDPPHAFNRYVCGLPTSVVADACGLQGPTYAIDAACSSALYAIKMSSYYLRSGKADIMLAGGVCAPDPWLIHTSFSDLRAYPRNNLSQPFNRDSTGIQTGQGAGMVVLKRLQDAIADGDRIYCTVEGLGLSNDGAGKHLLSPNPNGQIMAYRRAYEESAVKPSQVDYIECHATGTPLGDQTELNSLEAFFGDQAKALRLGSVKGMTGHLLTVAGLTSLVKLILSLQNETLVPTAGVDSGNSRQSEGGTLDGARLLTEKQAWPAGDKPRFAAVSAFGFGGTNAHLILSDRAEARCSDKAAATRLPDATAIVGMSAHFGNCDNLTAFERTLFSGNSELRQRNPDDDTGLVKHDGAACGYVNGVTIEPLSFRIPPAELKHFNQQQLLMLKVADDALSNAGLTRDSTAMRNISVILVLELDLISHLRRAKAELPYYLERLLGAAGIQRDRDDFDALVKSCGDALHSDIEPNEVLSYIGNIMASRISSLWNLTGPSFTLSGDGNGAFHALETARLMLAEGDTDGVLVGAVDLCCIAEELELGKALNTTQGLHRPSTTANGEGAGAVLIMRDQDAVQHKMRRYACFGEHDDLAEHAEIGLVQMAGPLNDDGSPAELARIAALADNAALVSAVGNLGYSRVAAPIAGLIAASLALYHRYLPAQNKLPKAELTRFKLAFEGRQLYRPSVSYPWFKSPDTTRAALLTGSAVTGAVDSLFLYEGDWPDDALLARQTLNITPIAATDVQALAARLATFGDALNDQDFARLREQCWQALKDKSSQSRLVAAIVAPNATRFARECAQLRKHLMSNKSGDWKTPAGSFFAAQAADGDVAFVYPGGFNSYPYLANGLFRLFPSALQDFENNVEDVGLAMSRQWIYPRQLAPLRSRDLMKLEQEMLQDIPAMLTNGTSLALLYSKILRDVFQIAPKVAFGYSLGESSMLFANGVWPARGRSYDQLAASPLFQDELTGRRNLIRRAWQLPEELPDKDVWDSYLLIADSEQVKAAIEPYDRVFVTHINTPGEVLIAGAPAQLRGVIDALKCEVVHPPTAHVLHAEAMRAAQTALAGLNAFPSQAPSHDIQIISAGHYEVLDTFERDHIADLNSDSLCREVDFPRLMDIAYGLGGRVFIEVGPGGTCSRWVDNQLGSLGASAFCITQRGKTDSACFEQLLARMISLQVPMDLSALRPTAAQQRKPTLVDIHFRAATCMPEFAAPSVDTALDQTSRTLGGAALAVRSKNPSANAASITTQAHTVADKTPSTARKAASPDGGGSHKGSHKKPPHKRPSRRQSLLYWQLNASQLRTVGRIAPPSATPSDTPSATPSAVATTHSSPRSLGSQRKPAMAFKPSTSARNLTPVNAVVRNSIALMHSNQKAFMDSQHQIQNLVLGELRSQLETAQHHTYQHVPAPEAAAQGALSLAAPAAPAIRDLDPGSTSPRPVMDEAQLLAFASGSIVDAFGPEYAEIDGYPVRVRLPSPPYFFVSRVTRIEAERGKYEPCMLTTEYDIPEDAWYLVDGVMPPGVAVEAGQSDLLLISYLGIDFENQGQRMYRLLDGKLAFIGDLPRAGQTLRFDIHINAYVRQGGVMLFFFSYEGYVDDTLALKLERGCAGFFTPAQLEQGQGLLKHPQDDPASLIKPLIKSHKEQLTREDLLALKRGELGPVFGPYSAPQGATGVRLPPEQLLMIDRISVLNRPLPSGYLQIEAFKALDPQGWYFESHFVDDPVLPGSLVAEGATQILKVHMMSIGLAQCLADAEFQPIPDLLMDINVRGQITPKITTLRYVVEIFENGLLPRPYVKGHVVVYDGDRPLVAVKNLGLCLKEKPGTTAYPRYGELDYFSGRRLSDGTAVVLNEFHLAHAAKGDLKTAMGREFGIYGPQHRAPYIPNGDFQFVDRAVTLTGDRGQYQNGSVMITEYDVPEDDWYLRQNSYPAMPNCVYLESALQASILLGYFLGVTLDFPNQELSIRNLDGKATYLNDVDLRGKTIRHKETLLSTSTLNGTILQKFRFELSANGQPIYEGESMFGYFPEEALANQLGIDNGKPSDFWYQSHDEAAAELIEYDTEQERDNPLYEGSNARPYYRLPSNQLNLLHRASLHPEGGKYGKGYVFGYREIRESDWYFKCHFHRDPVMPGSLGLEAFVQAIQLYAIYRQLGTHKFASPRFGIAPGVETEWRYRGQILKQDRDMNIEIHIKEIRDEPDRILVIADADLFKGRLRIYHVDQMAIAITEGKA